MYSFLHIFCLTFTLIGVVHVKENYNITQLGYTSKSHFEKLDQLEICAIPYIRIYEIAH